VFTDLPTVKDQRIQLGVKRKNAPQVQVRLGQVRFGTTWYSYLTSVLDPQQLPPFVMADLYRRRWRIEIRQPQCPHKSEAIDDEAVLALTVFWETLEHSLKALKGIRMGQLQWEVS
jgi:hypothetical protein